MEKHCVSLEIAKQLKEVGYPQKTIWCWVFNKGRYENENRTYLLETCNAYNFKPNNYWCSPLATEILEELPRKWVMGKYKTGEFSVVYKEREFIDKSLPNALALMWLYLHKEKLLEER